MWGGSPDCSGVTHLGGSASDRARGPLGAATSRRHRRRRRLPVSAVRVLAAHPRAHGQGARGLQGARATRVGAGRGQMGTKSPGTPRAWHLPVLRTSSDSEFREMLGGSPDMAGCPFGTFWKPPTPLLSPPSQARPPPSAPHRTPARFAKSHLCVALLLREFQSLPWLPTAPLPAFLHLPPGAMAATVSPLPGAFPFTWDHGVHLSTHSLV